MKTRCACCRELIGVTEPVIRTEDGPHCGGCASNREEEPMTSSVDTINLGDLLDEIAGSLETYSEEELRGALTDLVTHVKRLQIERDGFETKAQLASACLADMTIGLDRLGKTLDDIRRNT